MLFYMGNNISSPKNTRNFTTFPQLDLRVAVLTVDLQSTPAGLMPAVAVDVASEELPDVSEVFGQWMD